MASVAHTPASIQVSVEGNSTLGRESSLYKPRSARHFRPRPKKMDSANNRQSTAASIPSRYQTYFLPSNERKGFNSQAVRFSTDVYTINENPGPGKYVPNSHTESQSTSFSKKGTGGFASNCHRFRTDRKQTLGPGSYDPHPMENRVDFNQAGVSSNFQLPIAVKQEASSFGASQKNASPAPNTYNLSGVHMGKNSTMAAEAAFKSKTKRETIFSKSADNPAPGQYLVKDSVLYPSPCAHKSVFNSKSHRIALGKVSQGPGPADYMPVTNEIGDVSKFNPPKQLPYYRQKHYLCISAPAIPLPPLPPLPGPGHYETQSPILEPHGESLEQDQEKKLVSGAVFKSTTSRWMSFGLDRQSEPGPGTYNPTTATKQSYLYNVKKKWV